MKKIITIVVFFMAFSYASQAQETSKNVLNTKELAINNVSELSKSISLDNKLNSDITTLFLMRDEAVKAAATAEEKKNVYELYGKKLLTMLTDEQKAQLMKNKELYTKFTVYSTK